MLIHAIGALKSESAGGFLSLLYPSLADKALQKLVKKALFGPKTQGIPVEEPRIPGESVLKRVETGREARAFLSNYDPEMTRVVLSALEMKKNQFVLSHAVLHFSDGFVDSKSLSVAKDELEGLPAGLRHADGAADGASVRLCRLCRLPDRRGRGPVRK